MIKKLEIPINVGMQGIIKATETDVRTGKKKVRIIQNTLLDDFMDAFFTCGSGLADVSNTDNVNVINKCFIGDSDISPSQEQLGIQGNILAETDSGVVTKDIVISNGTISCAKKFTFPAGVGTGTVKEVVLESAPRKSPYYISYLIRKKNVARQIFSTPIEKNEYIQIDIEWELRINIGNSIWTGTLENGQRDGTPVTWTATINHEQWGNIIMNKIRSPRGYSFYNYGAAFCPFFMLNSNYGDPFITTGDSNAQSDIINDGGMDIKGNEIETFQITINYIDYVAQSRERQFQIYFNTTETNYPIYEILLSSMNPSDAYTDDLGLMRITFNPALDKVNTHRLYITPTFKITTGGA